MPDRQAAVAEPEEPAALLVLGTMARGCLRSGLTFPDALAAGPALGRAGQPILLTAPTGLTSTVSTWISAHPSVSRTYLYGGTPTLDTSIADQLANALG